MVELLDLPAELLYHIVSNFQYTHSTDASTLLRLCRTCRKLRDVAQPALHSSIRYYVPRNREVKGYAPTALERGWRLTRTTLSRPDLANKIKTLFLRLDVKAPDLYLIIGENEFLERFFPYDCPGTKRGSIRSLSFEDLANILFCRLGNLEQLHFQLIQLPPPRNLLQKIDVANEGQFSIRETLKKLSVESESVPFNIADFRMVFKWPSLRTVHFKRCVASRDIHFGAPLRLPSGSIRVTELILDGCYVRNEGLRGILKACHSLRSFRYAAPKQHFDFLGVELRRTYSFTPRQLIKALEDYNSDSLEELNVLFETTYETGVLVSSPTRHWKHRSFPNLQNLTHLKRLTMEFFRLREISHLPPKLRNLHFTRCNGHNHLICPKWINQDFFSLKQNCCPNIEEVSVSGSRSRGSISPFGVFGIPHFESLGFRLNCTFSEVINPDLLPQPVSILCF